MISDHAIGVVGLVVGILGVLLALRSDRKLRTTEQARARVERKFTQYMGAQEFKKLAVDGLAIIQDIRNSDWASVAAKAGLVNLDLPHARGARGRLLTALESDKLDAAVAAMRRLSISLPLATETPTSQEIQTMIFQCHEMVDLAGELGGRLSVESMSETEE